MTSNDVLSRLRYMFDFSDAEMVAVFADADHAVTAEQVKNWLSKEESPLHEKLADRDLAVFLNGLIIHRRGKRPGAQPAAETRLDNNTIVRKLKIAMNMQSEDMIWTLALADFTLSNHELSAFFRKPGHKHYRKINDQVLRYFMRGLQIQLRPSAEDEV